MENLHETTKWQQKYSGDVSNASLDTSLRNMTPYICLINETKGVGRLTLGWKAELGPPLQKMNTWIRFKTDYMEHDRATVHDCTRVFVVIYRKDSLNTGWLFKVTQLKASSATIRLHWCLKDCWQFQPWGLFIVEVDNDHSNHSIAHNSSIIMTQKTQNIYMWVYSEQE